VLAYRADTINSTLEKTIKDWGEKLRAAMLEGQERQESYVNYAVKQESLNALYGYVLKTPSCHGCALDLR
jgi:hypothetical protein